MRMNCYSVYDKAVNAFLPPFYARHAGEAIRSFTDLANDSNTNVNRHPLDFVLMFVGEFDDVAGKFIPQEPMRLLGANEVLNPGQVPVIDASEKNALAGLNGSG